MGGHPLTEASVSRGGVDGMEEGFGGRERGLLLVSALAWGTLGLVSSNSKPGGHATIRQRPP